MGDMLVKLYGDRPPSRARELEKQGILIKRALGADKQPVLSFIESAFPESCPAWLGECEVALLQQPATCFIAVKDKQVVGFCCYDATAKGMLGPIGTSASLRGHGIATELIRQSLEAMKAAGYAYAAIGWVSSESFYQKACGAAPIADSSPGIYQRLVTQ